MFNTGLLMIVIILCIPGILLMTKHTAKTLLENPENTLSKEKLTLIIWAQTLVIVALCAGLGVYFGPKVGLTDPFLEGITRGELLLTNLSLQSCRSFAGVTARLFGWFVIMDLFGNGWIRSLYSSRRVFVIN